ncbi:MAG: peroxide stress protein YaaA [Roseovarius sp.]
MLVVLSPAKKLDMSAVDTAATDPHFADDATALAKVARGLKPADLQKLMGISATLAKLNAERFRDFGTMETKPAALAFAGDTYTGLDATSLDPEEMDYAQDHLRILSGLYGLLRPRDAIEPYRLEMGSRLKTRRGKSLYDYWGDRIAKALNAQAETLGTDTLVNCASQEYFGAVRPAALSLRVVTPVFMEEKPGGPKVVSFFAKQARGAMARFILQRRLTEAESLSEFDSGGYRHRPDLSGPGKPVFVRPQQAA